MKYIHLYALQSYPNDCGTDLVWRLGEKNQIIIRDVPHRTYV